MANNRFKFFSSIVMAIEIKETERNTLLVNGKELSQVNDSWVLMNPEHPLTNQEQIAVLNYLNKGELKPVPAVDVMNDVLAECRRQDEKWGADRDHTPAEWLMILGEEVGEVNRAALEHHFKNPAVTDLSHYRTELVQVAAVAVQMIKCHDRQAAKALKESYS